MLFLVFATLGAATEVRMQIFDVYCLEHERYLGTAWYLGEIPTHTLPAAPEYPYFESFRKRYPYVGVFRFCDSGLVFYEGMCAAEVQRMI